MNEATLERLVRLRASGEMLPSTVTVRGQAVDTRRFIEAYRQPAPGTLSIVNTLFSERLGVGVIVPNHFASMVDTEQLCAITARHIRGVPPLQKNPL